MPGPYHIKTDIFEGPLDMLLELIEKRKLFINDLSLASVTDEYIEYINRKGMFELPSAAHFVYVASTLLLIKSKSLLPTLTLSEEEAGDITDLKRRLVLFKRFKELALALARLYGRKPLYARAFTLQRKPVFSPQRNLTLSFLEQSLSALLRDLPWPKRFAETIVEKTISLDQMIEHLAQRIKKAVSLSFKEFAREGNHHKKRMGVIVSFLALLELVRRGKARANQESAFDDIIIEADSVTLPRYNQ